MSRIIFYYYHNILLAFLSGLIQDKAMIIFTTKQIKKLLGVSPKTSLIDVRYNRNRIINIGRNQYIIKDKTK